MEMDRPITQEKTGEIFCHLQDGKKRECLFHQNIHIARQLP